MDNLLVTLPAVVKKQTIPQKKVPGSNDSIRRRSRHWHRHIRLCRPELVVAVHHLSHRVRHRRAWHRICRKLNFEIISKVEIISKTRN